MATAAFLDDLHEEIKDQIAVLCARLDGLNNDIPDGTKTAILAEARLLAKRGENILKLIDRERIRLKCLEDPPAL
jgi:hypothetical protein